MGRTACTEPQCLYKGALYLKFNNVTQTANGRPQEATDCQLQDAEWRLHVKGVKTGA